MKHKSYNNTPLYENDYMKYQGKEFEQALGINMYDFGARQYDPAIGRWSSIDPLAEKFYDVSTFNAMMNNPIIMIDPDGRAASPIYDVEGTFLGTDDQGLQGKAIVMDKEDFTQGMSHEKALTKSKGAEGLNSKEAGSKLLNHYQGLKDRPDYDGKMSYSELVDWGKENGDSPVYLDASKIDLGGISVEDFDGVGSGLRINTVGRGTPLDTFGPWGKNYMTLMSNDGKVKLYPDEFDFRQHNLGDAWNEGIGVFLYESLIRVPAIGVLQTFHGVGNDYGFTMFPYGQAQLKPPKVKDTFVRFGE